MFVGTNAVAWSCREWYKGVRMPFRSGLKKPCRVKLIGSVPNVRISVQVVDMHKTGGSSGNINRSYPNGMCEVACYQWDYRVQSQRLLQYQKVVTGITKVSFELW